MSPAGIYSVRCRAPPPVTDCGTDVADCADVLATVFGMHVNIPPRKDWPKLDIGEQSQANKPLQNLSLSTQGVQALLKRGPGPDSPPLDQGDSSGPTTPVSLCPVCFHFNEVTGADLIQCNHCMIDIHSRCYTVWLEWRERLGMPSSCPSCRCLWAAGGEDVTKIDSDDDLLKLESG